MKNTKKELQLRYERTRKKEIKGALKKEFGVDGQSREAL